MDIVDRKPHAAVRRPATAGKRSFGGVVGVVALAVTVVALAISTYLDAPPISEGDGAGPTVHWGGR